MQPLRNCGRSLILAGFTAENLSISRGLAIFAR